MPIYRYKCEDCGIESDYLVRKMGATPDGGCKECDNPNLERIYHGQTFAVGTKTAVIKFDGEVKTKGLEDVCTADKLEPGVHLTTGLTEDGKVAINVLRVREDGKVDASVTGINK